MMNIDDAAGFMILRNAELETWFTFLKTKNAVPGTDDGDLHEAARLAIEHFDRENAEGKGTPELVEQVRHLYELQGWELLEGGLGSVQVDAITDELHRRYDLAGFYKQYAVEHKNDATPVAFSNEQFVTAWTGEVLRLDQKLTGV